MTAETPGDRELVVAVRDGDARAFDLLVRRHLRAAVRLAARLLGDDDAAEDVVQDSFLAVLESLDGFDENRSFAPWFYRIVANRCSNLKRSRDRRPTEALPSSLESDEPGPEGEAERRALGSRLKAALDGLPERQRQILMLYDVEGFTGPEISEMLDISSATVRWHLHQARAAMRATLEVEAQEER